MRTKRSMHRRRAVMAILSLPSLAYAQWLEPPAAPAPPAPQGERATEAATRNSPGPKRAALDLRLSPSDGCVECLLMAAKRGAPFVALR